MQKIFSCHWNPGRVPFGVRVVLCAVKKSAQGAGYQHSSSAVGKEPSTPRNRLKPGEMFKGRSIG